MFSDMATRFVAAQKGVERLPILEVQLQSLTSEADQFRTDKQTSEKDLLECRTELGSLRKKVASVSKEKAELTIAIKNLKEKQLSEETALTERFQAQLGRLIGSMQQKDKEYSQLESMHSAMVEELTMEQGEVEKMIDELEAKELSQLKEITRLKKVVKDAERRETVIRDQLSQWKQYQQETDTEKSNQIEILMQQQSEIEKEHEDHMTTELARRDGEIEKYRQQNQNQDAEIKKLKEEIAEKSKWVQDMIEQDKETKERMFALQDNLLRFTDKLSQKDDEIKMISSESEKLTTSLQAQLSSFEEEILERDQFIDELSSNNVKQVENLAQMRHQNEALSAEMMALSQSVDAKDAEIAHLIQHHGSLDAKIQDVMERENAMMEKSNQLIAEREKIEKLFREREAIEMEKRAWTQREQQLQNFENQVKEKHRDVTEVLRREAEVSKREEGLLRRESAIERIEEKQREQIALHMKSIAENQRNLSMQKTELSELEQVLQKRRQQMKEMEKQHQENIVREAAAVEEAGARMKEIGKRLTSRDAQLDARDQLLKNKKDDLALMEKELNHRKKMLDGREAEVKNGEENVKFRKNKVDNDERRLYFGTAGEAEQPKNYYVSRTSMMASRPEHLGKFKVSGARDRAVSSVDAQNNIYHQMWRVKEAQIRKDDGSRPVTRRQTIAVTPGAIEKIQATASSPLIAPPNLPSLDAMLDEEEKREASPDAPMVMLLPTEAPVAPPVPLEARRASVNNDQTEGASILTNTAKQTDEGPDMLIGGGVLDDDFSHPPDLQPTQTSNDTEGSIIMVNSHPPAPVPAVIEPIASDAKRLHPPAPFPNTPTQRVSHPPAPVPTTPTNHPPAPVLPKASTSKLIAVETKQGIGRVVESADKRLMAEFLPNQIWDVDLASCIPLTSGAKMFSPYGPCTLVSMTGEGALVVQLESGETTIVESRSCRSEYRHHYGNTLAELCFGDKVESELEKKKIPDDFLMDLRFHDMDRKIKISLDGHGRRVFSLRI